MTDSSLDARRRRRWRSALLAAIAAAFLGVAAGAAPALAGNDWRGHGGWHRGHGVILRDGFGRVLVVPPGSQVIIVPPGRKWVGRPAWAWRDPWSRPGRSLFIQPGFGADPFLRTWRAPERFFVPGDGSSFSLMIR
jgi:hypothetical protein